ncbi:chitobiosyldiphosphodolichol beta-mannosyltransferase [Neocloeon triangulifer]|uniref:chitobiosyldiphosphodolichol beta-mannosyltransferase n=1 Tax=Neocloeon triangulifer TaxID=2078957 RepID=UPI00286F7C30|nr:chitobiosyldiphosphodolichol beta-mannosyltransferase [Neocloeon triangulifer]XP_059472118.1 chitobiosyldiphosphodolichol beta-mannosyltransferase [Neocloeon triangulifer]
MSSRGSKRACVVVLGDIGRSPRMQYHSLSLAKEGINVDLVGYQGSVPIKELTQNSSIQLHFIQPCPNFRKYLPGLCAYVLKALWQAVTLLLALIWVRLSEGRCSHLLMQNPPSVPTLGVCWIFCRIVNPKCRFIIDWHNYGYSVMAAAALSNKKEEMTEKNLPILPKITYWLEGWFGQRADAGLCVTRAMKEDLLERWGVRVITLYDRPPMHFQPIAKPVDVLAELSQHYSDLGTALNVQDDRPVAILVSSTSWTEDEDFNILLDALQEYEDARSQDPDSYPFLVCAITGKGPLKEFYKAAIAKKEWINVKVVTPWLQAEDYPKLLGCANLGVSLHTSTSGLDLPMKVVDMFGCGLPVLAYDFKCLGELVKEGKTGKVFTDSSELAKQLLDWLRGFPSDLKQQQLHKSFRDNIKKWAQLRWDQNWKTSAAPIFTYDD